MKIGIVAGEASGDILGAGLLSALKLHFPDASFVGVGGEKMVAEGFTSLYPQDRLAVMGIVEPLKRLPELLRIRRHLLRYFVAEGFDLFIGIDSPDFNLSLEEKLRRNGMATVHYVSPSVWAWRQRRIKKIARAVDLMLTLLPFENALYERHNIPVVFVGHPLANTFPLEPDIDVAREHLTHLLSNSAYTAAKPLLACLPGSRASEVEFIGPVFWQVLVHLQQQLPDLQMIVPAVNPLRYQQIDRQLQAYPQLNIELVEGCSHPVMAAADAVLLASGTTALEAMLLKKPMVVVYKLRQLSYWIFSKLIKVPYISLPNLLADKPLVPELIQGQATPAAIVQQVQQQLTDGDKQAALRAEFVQLHRQIRRDANRLGAQAIVDLMGSRS
ncbi:MAG: lipid-A-disaccharide synthase [Cellvibrionaceae bacterium]|nr:lipid-A-disaccharide synthase [Cellvibrionaceae bacterium]